jgi:hypothetical protein
MRKIQKKDKEKGYILFEILVSLLIISIVLTSILGGFSFLGKLTGDSWNRTKTVITDRNEFEKLQRLPE